jgi:hypothetical protein
VSIEKAFLLFDRVWQCAKNKFDYGSTDTTARCHWRGMIQSIMLVRSHVQASSHLFMSSKASNFHEDAFHANSVHYTDPVFQQIVRWHVCLQTVYIMYMKSQPWQLSATIYQ